MEGASGLSVDLPIGLHGHDRLKCTNAALPRPEKKVEMSDRGLTLTGLAIFRLQVGMMRTRILSDLFYLADHRASESYFRKARPKSSRESNEAVLVVHWSDRMENY